MQRRRGTGARPRGGWRALPALGCQPGWSRVYGTAQVYQKQVPRPPLEQRDRRFGSAMNQRGCRRKGRSVHGTVCAVPTVHCLVHVALVHFIKSKRG